MHGERILYASTFHCDIISIIFHAVAFFIVSVLRNYANAALKVISGKSLSFLACKMISTWYCLPKSWRLGLNAFASRGYRCNREFFLSSHLIDWSSLFGEQPWVSKRWEVKLSRHSIYCKVHLKPLKKKFLVILINKKSVMLQMKNISFCLQNKVRKIKIKTQKNYLKTSELKILPVFCL